MFTIAIALHCATAATEQPPVTILLPCERRGNHGKERWKLKNGPSTPLTDASDSRCILLSATPYNKSYLDLCNQLRPFVPDDKDLGVRPERKLKELTEVEFIRRHQCSVRSLAAFEKRDYADDWRELMRLYMVRRTRTFIQETMRKPIRKLDDNS